MKSVEEILHSLLVVGITAASVFVKNPAHRQLADTLASLLANEVLPAIHAVTQASSSSAAPSTTTTTTVTK